MGKLQPNFSWQKYEGKPEDQKEQFQYQLQQEHIVVANSINTTIDDLSYWLLERPTAFTWINTVNTKMGGQQIYTKTFRALVSAFPVNHGIVSKSGAALQLNLVRAYGVVQDTIPMTAVAYPVPYCDPTTLGNGIGLNVTTTQVVLVTSGGNYSTYTATITIEYTKN
jgi:hypothetical protein